MMKKLGTALILIIFGILFSCGPVNVAGTVDETDTSIAGFVSIAGEPVQGATVKIYIYHDSTGVPLDSLVTDEDGEYDISQLPDGVYSIWAETDTSVFFNDSVVISESFES
ncbi:MAG: carboxypeptidase regulatory-like domain-containing protein, partial [Cytophagales bacterium]|nr:carboxypeptidase regulatory-like domain-containing protein [Cytophagales bacterium]